MRPRSIIWFERVNLLMLALVIPYDYLIWDDYDVPAGSEFEDALTFTLVAQGIIIGLMLVMIWMISRERSRVFKWIYVLLSSLGVTGIAGTMSDHLRTGSGAIVLVQAFLTMVGIALLFWPAARDWLAGRDPVDPTVFR